MAHKLAVTGQQLPFIWNVSSKVGDARSCINSRTDVELVVYLLDFIVSRQQRNLKGNLIVNGEFDVAAAYHIYSLQADRKYTIPRYNSCQIDGIISPAKHFDDIKWTIVYMNAVMHNLSKQTFMNLCNDPKLSPTLRAELSGVNRLIR